MGPGPDRPVGGLAVRPPKGIELQPLTRSDLVAATTLARAARGLDPAPPSDEMARRFDALINSADTVGFLARAAEASAGLVVMQLRRRLNFATFEGWISDLHVSAGRQDADPIRASLLETAVAEWKLRQGHRVLISVGAHDRALAATLAAGRFEEAFLDFALRPLPAVEPSVADGTTLRPLADADADRVTRLIAEFGARRSPVPDRMEAVLRTYAAHVRDIRSGRAASIVADVEGATVGVCTMEWQRPFWTDELHAWIPDLVVTERLRGRGLGRALLHAAIARARTEGAAEVRLESGAQRAAAHGLYRTTGFADTGRTWLLRPEEGA